MAKDNYLVEEILSPDLRRERDKADGTGAYRCYCSQPSIGSFETQTIAGRMLIRLCKDHAPTSKEEEG